MVGLNALPLFPLLKAPLPVGLVIVLALLLVCPKAFGCLASSLKLSFAEEIDENGPFDNVADENPTGMTDPTCGVLSGLVCDLPVRCGSFSGLLGTGYS